LLFIKSNNMKLKNERDFCTELQKWMRHNINLTLCWEAKFIRGSCYNFKSDKSLKKEINNLKICNRVLVTKFSDIARMGTLFDGIKIAGAPGFFFFMYEKSQPKFYIIEVSALNDFIRRGNKSLNEEDAQMLGYIHQLETKKK